MSIISNTTLASTSFTSTKEAMDIVIEIQGTINLGMGNILAICGRSLTNDQEMADLFDRTFRVQFKGDRVITHTPQGGDEALEILNELKDYLDTLTTREYDVIVVSKCIFFALTSSLSLSAVEDQVVAQKLTEVQSAVMNVRVISDPLFTTSVKIDDHDFKPLLSVETDAISAIVAETPLSIKLNATVVYEGNWGELVESPNLQEGIIGSVVKLFEKLRAN